MRTPLSEVPAKVIDEIREGRGKLAAGLLAVPLAKPRKVGRNGDAKSPCRQHSERSCVSLEEPLEIIALVACHDVDEHPTTGRIDADRHPVPRRACSVVVTFAPRPPLGFLRADTGNPGEVDGPFLVASH